jgi:hypothetical protein
VIPAGPPPTTSKLISALIAISPVPECHADHSLRAIGESVTRRICSGAWHTPFVRPGIRNSLLCRFIVPSRSSAWNPDPH